MRIAKTLALLFALVLVVVCFNSPVVLADVPWDEDGIGDGTGVDNTPENETDTITVIFDPGTIEDDIETGGLIDDPDISGLLFDIEYFILFHVIPGN